MPVSSTISLSHPSGKLQGELQLGGSKSESNRLLILKALYPSITPKNLSDSDDTAVMKRALFSSKSKEVDIYHAGTAMRFLTSYYSIQGGVTTVLTGSSRMKQRPIAILVDALRALGAKIEYLEKDGYPPLKIEGTKLTRLHIAISAATSSQYITALLLIAPKLKDGLKIELIGSITSLPYLSMTIRMMQQLGFDVVQKDKYIQIAPAEDLLPVSFEVESDWSSASYHYSMAALAQSAQIRLKTFKPNSLQGDKVLISLYEKLGVHSRFEGTSLILEKMGTPISFISEDLRDCPDLAQTLAVSCFGLGIGCDLYGLHTLRIKETDRLNALLVELKKLGATISVTENSLHLKASAFIPSQIAVHTYDDHRMAMAFAPLALLGPIKLSEPQVVGKSYPNFWNDLRALGFITDLNY